MQGRQAPLDPDFVTPLMQLVFDAMLAGFSTEPKIPRDTTKLAAGPKAPRIPRNPAELQAWWDYYRSFQNLKKKAPQRILVLANKIRTAYVRKVQSIWQSTSTDFQEGKIWDQVPVRAAVQDALRVAESRAQMIVRTETTRYYNQARINYYDQLPAVTHYIFVSIRDKATTPWCRPYPQGRNGLVYKKGSDLFKKNSPPCHWNCRSEILPLTPQFDKRDKQLVDDKSRAAENNHPTPLPPGWNSDTSKQEASKQGRTRIE